jgi:hypothetical protein
MANFGRGPGWGNRPGQSGSTAGSGTTTSQRRGGPDRRAAGLGAQGQLTKRQKEAIADAQRQKNLQRDAMQRQQRLQDEMNQQIEARRLQKLEEQRQQRLQDEMNQQIEARRLQKLEEQRQQRLQDEMNQQIEARRLEEQRLADEAEEQKKIDTAKEYQKTFQEDLNKFAETIEPYKPYSLDDAARMSINQLTDSQRQALEDRGFDLANLAYTPGEGILGLEQQPMIRDINTGEIVGYPSEGLTGYLGAAANLLGVDTSGINFGTDPMAERGIGDRGQGNELGLSPAVYTQIQADAQAAAEAAAEAAAAAAAVEADAQAEQEEILTGFSPQYTTSPATSGIATVPATGNYMDYMQYAFRPVNLADPFGGSPTQTITGYNPLFADNPVYAADGGRVGFKPGGSVGYKDIVERYAEGLSQEDYIRFIELSPVQQREEMKRAGVLRDDMNKGGRVGKMHGGIMVMGDEGVVNNGIGGILSKYKEIRSEL